MKKNTILETTERRAIVEGCMGRIRQLNRLDGGYNADCSSISNFSDSSSSSVEVLLGINLNAPRKTIHSCIQSSRRPPDVSSTSREKINISIETKGLGTSQVESGSSQLQHKGNNDLLTATSNLPKSSLHHGLCIPLETTVQKKTSEADGSTLSDSGPKENKNEIALHESNSLLVASRNESTSLTSIRNIQPAKTSNRDGHVRNSISRKQLLDFNLKDLRTNFSSENLLNAKSAESKGGKVGADFTANQQGYLTLLESCLPFFDIRNSSSTKKIDMKEEMIEKTSRVAERARTSLEAKPENDKTGDNTSTRDSSDDNTKSRTRAMQDNKNVDNFKFQKPSSSTSSALSDAQNQPSGGNTEDDALEEETQQLEQHLHQHIHQEQRLHGPQIVSDTMAIFQENNNNTNGSGGSSNDTFHAHPEVGNNYTKYESVGNADITPMNNSGSETLRNHYQQCAVDEKNTNRSESYDTNIRHIDLSHKNKRHYRAISSSGQTSTKETTLAHTRLAMKKRKRMNRRREYEEVKRQFQDSSESCETFSEELFYPGHLVSLEDALSFTKIARLIVQSSPPFSIVHSNAASIQLTNYGSSSLIGKPISALMSIVEKASNIVDKKISAKNSIAQKSNLMDFERTSSALQSEVHLSEHAIDKKSQCEICFDVIIGSSEINQYYAVTLLGNNRIEKLNKKDSSSGCTIYLMSICPVGKYKSKLKERLITLTSPNQRHNGAQGGDLSLKKPKHNLKVHRSSEIFFRNEGKPSKITQTENITHYAIQLLPKDKLSDCFPHSDDNASHVDPNHLIACG